jgi:hypothetical protein
VLDICNPEAVGWLSAIQGDIRGPRGLLFSCIGSGGSTIQGLSFSYKGCWLPLKDQLVRDLGFAFVLLFTIFSQVIHGFSSFKISIYIGTSHCSSIKSSLRIATVRLERMLETSLSNLLCASQAVITTSPTVTTKQTTTSH